MDDEAPDFLELPRILTVDEASRYGISAQGMAWRTSTGEWRRLLPRTCRTGTDVTRYDRLRAALAFAGPGSLLSGAAALWSSEFRIAFPDTVLVLVPPTNWVRSTAWVRIRRTSRAMTQLQDIGPTRVEVARAVADHALTLTRLDDVRHIVARAIRESRCTLDELSGELEAGPRNGSALLRQALSEVAAGAASAPEARAAAILRRCGAPPFEQNVRIHLPDGRCFVLDLYWRRLRAVLEIDSVEYHLDPADWRATMDRHLALSTYGLSVVHRPPSALADETRFVQDVKAWLDGLARNLPGADQQALHTSTAERNAC
jgi:hypothetical protein